MLYPLSYGDVGILYRIPAGAAEVSRCAETSLIPAEPRSIRAQLTSRCKWGNHLLLPQSSSLVPHPSLDVEPFHTPAT